MNGKVLAKRALGALYSLRSPSSQRRIVLLYHSLGDGPLALNDDTFRKQMEWLASVAEIVPLGALLAARSRSPLQVAITFDDGYASVHAAALPLLRDAGGMAAVFLNTAWIGVRERKRSVSAQGHYPNDSFLLWREVEGLAAAGWEVGSHGVDHLDLTRQPDAIVRAQLNESRARIRDVLDVCSPVFAYTWGHNTRHLRRLVAECRYTYALGGVHGAVSETSNPMALPRIDIARTYSMDDFKAIVRGDWDYLAWLQQARSFAMAVNRRKRHAKD